MLNITTHETGNPKIRRPRAPRDSRPRGRDQRSYSRACEGHDRNPPRRWWRGRSRRPQVGETDALCVVEVPSEYDADENGVRFNPDVKMPLVLVNPEIIEASKETEIRDEGCLSFPGIYAPVRRPVEIELTFMDLKGRTQTLRLARFVARVVQHEMDHLHGVLLVNRMPRLKKIALAGQLKRLRKETREEIGVA